MSDPMKQAWTDVGEGFSALGRLMKDRYQAGADDVKDGADEAGTALRDALDKLAEAAREVGDRTTDVARDDEVRAQAKRAAGSLNDALSATVDLIGEQVGGLFKRGKSDGTTPEVPASEPPADDARQ